jgi:urate oxidase
MTSNTMTVSYGKFQVPVYRVYAHPLTGIAPIPESQFTDRENILFALEIDVEVIGNNFLPAYTQGDNSNVVATDSMKNFILRQALAFAGATQEEFLAVLGRQFLQTYPQMERLRLTARELPFTAVPVPNADTFQPSSVLFSRSHSDFTFTTLEFTRTSDLPIEHQCGRVGLELLKVTGSAFTRFLHDEYTTLPERVDRPLFIHLDVYWKYTQSADLLTPEHSRYVPAEQVRDVIQVVFHEFVSESIQHLVHEMALRLLTRFPQLAEVSFAAQNRTRDQIAVSETNPAIKVYSDPFSAYGIIKLTMQNSEKE